MVFWMQTQEGLHLLLQQSLPLPYVSDSQQAEAAAAAQCIATIAQYIDVWQPTTIEIQGDNAAIIGVWNGTWRFHGAHLNSIIAEARTLVRYKLPSIEWIYMPRERNIVADELAGSASEWLASVISIFDEAPGEHMPPFEVPIGIFLGTAGPTSFVSSNSSGTNRRSPLPFGSKYLR